MYSDELDDADELFNCSTFNCLNAAEETENVDNVFGFVDGDERFQLRPLRRTDYYMGYMDLLSQLTTTGSPPVRVFQRYMDLLSQLTTTGSPPVRVFQSTFDAMKSVSDMYYIVVIEDRQTKQIVASGSLILEQKFIHYCGQRGRIEDIVVDSAYRGKQFGKTVVKCLIFLSRLLKLYKISLECKDSNVNWYSSMGFVKEQGNSNYMQIRLKEP